MARKYRKIIFCPIDYNGSKVAILAAMGHGYFKLDSFMFQLATFFNEKNILTYF